MTRKKAFTDTVSPRPRVTVDEHGVIDIAGLMAAMTVEEAVREATAELRGGTDEDTPVSELHPGARAKDLD
jgi:hypothetical protein